MTRDILLRKIAKGARFARTGSNAEASFG